MEGFSSSELGDRFDLNAAIAWGTLPFVALAPKDAPEILSAYVNTYLKEEIREEGLVRRVPPFVRFLAVAGRLNGQIVNGHNIARDAAVPRATVDSYFAILTDTLLGQFLPAWRPSLKVRETAHPKFYWFDSGVARAAAGLLRDSPDRIWLGTALETLIYHEIRVYNRDAGKHRPIAYYRTPAGVEVDFVIETRKRQATERPAVVLIEVKLGGEWKRSWEAPMRDLASREEVQVQRAFGVYLGERRYEEGVVRVLPVPDFLKALHAGEVF